MNHSLDCLLGQARGALLAEDDLDEGLEKAVDVLLAGGVVGLHQRQAARRALEGAIGLAQWRQRATALAAADSCLDTARSRLEYIDEDDLAEQVDDLMRQVQDLLPGTDDMPREEILGLRGLTEAFPGLLLEQLLAAGQPAAVAVEAAG